MGESIYKLTFGKHQGKELDQVPADYLDWLMGQDWIGKFPEIVKYVTNHKAAIHAELKREGKLDDQGDF